MRFEGATGPSDLRAGVAQMVERLAHRGPDGVGYTVTPAAAFGATRLAIRGLDDGAQPFVDEASGVIVVCNGEIDNHKELRDWLEQRGRPVAHATDVAVIPHLYLELGERFVDRLVGAFAVAIWDPRRGRLLLARDRAGERPLFFSRRQGSLVFASEVAALAGSGLLDVQPDASALAAYLRFGYFPAPSAPLAGVECLRPGEWIDFDGAGEKRRRYWQWTLTKAAKSPPSEDRFDAIFRAAIQSQSEVDVDFGVFLSGGVDSSLVASVMRDLRPEKRLNAYSLRFSDASYDEGAYAEQVARSLGVDFIPVWVRPEDFPPTLSRLIELTGVPLADPAWVPSTLLAQRARQDIRVALVGEGADELFGGYPTYIGAQYAAIYSRLPASVRGLVRLAVERWPASDRKVTMSFLLKRFVQGDELDGLARHRLWVSSIAPALLARLGISEILPEPASGVAGHLLDRIQSFDLENSLAEGLMTKADRSGMSCSLELRAPFLDKSVMEFAATLPPEERTKAWHTKIFIKRYALRYLSPDIVHRRKRGLSVPLSSWLRNPLYDWARDQLSSERLAAAGIRVAVAVDLLEEHRSRRVDHARALWTLIVLSEWLDWQARVAESQPTRSNAIRTGITLAASEAASAP